MKLLAISFLACSLIAGEKAPTVSDKARADFWKASLLAAQADAAKAAADARKLATVEAMQKECGDWKLDIDQQAQEPVCVDPAKKHD